MTLYELRVVRREEKPQIGKPTETEVIRITNIKDITGWTAMRGANP